MIDATGTYGNPNRLGDGGIEALGERALEDRITRTLEPLEGLAGSTVLLDRRRPQRPDRGRRAR